MKSGNTFFKGWQTDHEVRELTLPVTLDTLQHLLVKEVLAPGVPQPTCCSLSGEEAGDIPPLDGQVSLLLEVPEVIGIPRPAAEPAPVAEVLSRLKKGSQLLRRHQLARGWRRSIAMFPLREPHARLRDLGFRLPAFPEPDGISIACDCGHRLLYSRYAVDGIVGPVPRGKAQLRRIDIGGQSRLVANRGRRT